MTAPAGLAPATTGSVQIGTLCSDVGAISQTTEGKGVTCTKPGDGEKARWAPAKAGSVTVPGAIRPGAFCGPQGAKGKTAQGVAYTCRTTAKDKRARWLK
ncbi:hypothetical protein EBO15_38390 [Actinomadura harenae]|uniref:Uncharacterized protein n=1 Tax=Actinomadura harenae TaxID=2483351 RepID=A0A3M2LKK0_9ACTN|nr:hypothetical protein EBO15_38390 [Actinomadura harenae]